jgi:membrane protein
MANVTSAWQTVATQPRSFALQVLRAFHKNQGLLLSGALAYYILLSVIPLFTFLLLMLSHVVDQSSLIATLSRYIDLIIPADSTAVLEQVRNVLEHRELASWIVLGSMLFFSSLAFGVLESAMSIIFVHRVRHKPRPLFVSLLLPYVYILLLAVGFLVMTVIASLLQTMSEDQLLVLGRGWSLDKVSVVLLYLIGLIGLILVLTSIYLVMPPSGRVRPRHALVGGIAVGILWEATRHGISPHSRSSESSMDHSRPQSSDCLALKWRASFSCWEHRRSPSMSGCKKTQAKPTEVIRQVRAVWLQGDDEFRSHETQPGFGMVRPQQAAGPLPDLRPSRVEVFDEKAPRRGLSRSVALSTSARAEHPGTGGGERSSAVSTPSKHRHSGDRHAPCRCAAGTPAALRTRGAQGKRLAPRGSSSGALRSCGPPSAGEARRTCLVRVDRAPGRRLRPAQRDTALTTLLKQTVALLFLLVGVGVAHIRSRMP